MTFFGKDIGRFVIVGIAGFLVDGLILSGLVRFGGWNPFLARIVSMSVAVLCTWLAHRYWTFPSGRFRPALRQTMIYGLVQLTGLSINYVIFAALVSSGGVWRTFPVLAVAVGSIGAMAVTYVLCRTIAFADPRRVTR
jgi:putative flippase GtrA